MGPKMDYRRFRSPWLLLAAAYATLPIMAGCAGFATTEARNRQVALTGLMALDTAQTASFSKSDCLREINPIAVAIYGTDRPSSQRVLMTNALYMTGHWFLASYLDRKAESPIDLSISATEDMARRSRWRLLRGLYQGLTMIGHGAAVINNNLKGIRPFSGYDCGDAQ